MFALQMQRDGELLSHHSENLNHTSEEQLIGFRGRCLQTFRYTPVALYTDRAVFRTVSEGEQTVAFERGEPIDLFLRAPNGVHTVQGEVDVSERTEREESDPSVQVIRLRQSVNVSDMTAENGKDSQHDRQARLVGEMHRVLTDSVIRKRGMKIILQHLRPFFERLLAKKQRVDADNSRLELWKAMITEIDSNIDSLQKLDEELSAQSNNGSSEPIALSVDDIQRAIISEIPFLLCRVQFEGARALSYIRSVKKLERRLCSNYNQLVGCYQQLKRLS